MSTLVIVESPTKAKTISKFLGKGFKVESSFGHIRDLPKKEMGVDTADGTFTPHYEVPADKKKQVKKLKDLAADSDNIIFATDEDREGEAISWHLAQVLKIKPESAKRIVFHEITQHALEEAIKNPRHIDQKLVDAQQARRILDRLVGYELSPLLWKKIARGLSAGRVQSVAVRLVVEREREITNFKTEEYWTLEAIFKKEQANFSGKLYSIDTKKVNKLDLKTKEQVDLIIKELDGSQYVIENVVNREAKRLPPPPFTTSRLQQEANNKLGYSSKQTMVLAQQLYEGVDLGEHGAVGLITYMRTDSFNLSEKFQVEAGEYIKENFGPDFLFPRTFKTKAKGAQEAHEAIRPTDPKRTPDSVKSFLSPQQHKLYSLIWKRAVATQMSGAKLNKTSIDVKAKKYIFRISGQTMIFPGWLSLYPESIKEETIPELKIGEILNCENLKSEQHSTEPPARFSDATLVKTLEEYGIGRPSTYAPTIDTIEQRNYVERDDNKRLKPTNLAFLVNDFLTEHFPNIVDYNFTAEMEQSLDDVALGKTEWKPVIALFYHPFHEEIVVKQKTLTREVALSQRELGNDPESGKPISVRMGRYGAFVQRGTKEDTDKPQFAKLKRDQNVDTIELKEALELLSLPKILGKDESGNEILVSIGRFGPYVKHGEKFISIKEKDPYKITLEEAKEVIKANSDKEAKVLIKEFPPTSIKIKDGRYGPYITDGKNNVKVPKDIEPTSMTQKDCEKLLEAKAKNPNGFKRFKRVNKDLPA